MRKEVPRGRRFDFTAHMRELCQVISVSCPALAHVDCSRVAFAFAQTRKPGPYGMWASLTPLRFAGGSLVERRHGREYSVQRLYMADGREMLYILTFYLPRFLELSYEQKLDTVFHELWHIGPDFDGDVRRFTGRCYAHSHSQAEYDRQVGELVRQWNVTTGDIPQAAFLKYTMRELASEFGPIVGQRIGHPKLIPL